MTHQLNITITLDCATGQDAEEMIRKALPSGSWKINSSKVINNHGSQAQSQHQLKRDIMTQGTLVYRSEHSPRLMQKAVKLETKPISWWEELQQGKVVFGKDFWNKIAQTVESVWRVGDTLVVRRVVEV